jgi:two-component system response regulator NreC
MNTPLPIRIVIADDHPLYLEALVSLFKKSKDIDVCGQAKDGKELIDVVERTKPDVVLTDIKMPVLDGIGATKEIHRQWPNIGVLALTFSESDYVIVDMLEAGALGYLVKNVVTSSVIDAIYTVRNGKPFYCESTSRRLRQLIAESKFNPYKNHRELLLDDREREMVRMFCEEKTCHDVAEALCLSVRTVEGIRLKILDKIGIKNLAGMVVYAVKNGLFEIV